MSLVARKVWIRGGVLALSSACAARSMSSDVQRASAATFTGNARLTAWTASKSPVEAMGKPASMMSTPSSASLPAMRTFSLVVMLQPGACSPSRSVVSKMKTLGVAMADECGAPVEIAQIYNYSRIYKYPL